MISIVLPTYNRSHFLPTAIESILRQTFRDWELIIVDDGSTDATESIRTAVEDPRVRWIRIAHAGVSRARNVGILEAQYSWICFLDSDDAWAPRKLQRQIEALEEEPIYRAVYTNEIWIRRGKRVNQARKHNKFSGWIYRESLPLCIISPSSVMLHRGLLEEVSFFDEAFPVCEDYELWLRITARNPVRFLDENLIIKTGGHADQLSHSQWGLDRYRVRALLKQAESNRLSHQQLRWTAAEIVRKAEILAQGFKNRGKPVEAKAYSDLADAWRAFPGESGTDSNLFPRAVI